MERVKKYYNSNPQMEWERLETDVYGRIEFEVTSHFIHKYLRPEDRIIDIGGGPGRYTVHFLEKNHHVTLVDLSGGLLKKAGEEIQKRQLNNLLGGIYERSAVDLHGLEKDSYDVTLLLGPLYHLVDGNDRSRAIEEALRVTRPGGYIFSAIINRLCPIKEMFRWGPSEARNFLNGSEEYLNKLLETGVYLNEAEAPGQFTDAYFANTEEVPDQYQKHGIELVESFSCEGIAAFMNWNINKMVDNAETWQNMLRLLIKTSTVPSNLGAGEHSVFIGQKKV